MNDIAREAKNNAVLAGQILDNPVYQKAIIEAKGDIFDEWCTTKWFQVRKREKLWSMMNCAKKFEQSITKRITEGKHYDMIRRREESLNKVK